MTNCHLLKGHLCISLDGNCCLLGCFADMLSLCLLDCAFWYLCRESCYLVNKDKWCVLEEMGKGTVFQMDKCLCPPQALRQGPFSSARSRAGKGAKQVSRSQGWHNAQWR